MRAGVSPLITGTRASSERSLAGAVPFLSFLNASRESLYSRALTKVSRRRAAIPIRVEGICCFLLACVPRPNTMTALSLMIIRSTTEPHVFRAIPWPPITSRSPGVIRAEVIPSSWAR